MQLSKRSKPAKVHWTSLPPNEEKLEIHKFPDKKLVDTSIKDDVLNSSNLVSLKERINQLKINNNSENINKKPKIMPKPVVAKISKPVDHPLVTKVRGKLDKSFSTPSYDFSADGNSHNNFDCFDSNLKISAEDINNIDTKEIVDSCVINEEKIKRPDKPVLVFPKPPPAKNDDDISFSTSTGTADISCINKSVKPILYFPKPPPSKTDEIDLSKIKDTDMINMYEPQNSKIAEQLNRDSDTISRYSFDLKHEDNVENVFKSRLENHNGNSFEYDNIAVHLSQERVPISVESSKHSMNRFKNRSYLINKQQDSSDFEKNSFSDLSDVCPPLSLTDLSGSDDNIFRVDTKDNISLPSERTAIIPHQSILNAPATYPRQKAETKKSQPPIPPPRPSKPAELPKRTSYRAMLGAKAIGKKENKGQKQLFQRNPLINSNFR